MTREETLKIMAVLKAAYPGFYRGMSREDAGAAVNLWNTMFDKEPYSLVSAGVMALIAADTKGFPPAIGQVKEYIHRLQNPDEMTETEAWELVRKAVSRSGYYAKEEYEKLPPVLRRVVGSPSMLRDWAMADVEDFQTVIQSNFMRSYQARIKSAREFEALPSAVQEQLTALGSSLDLNRIGDGGHDKNLPQVW